MGIHAVRHMVATPDDRRELIRDAKVFLGLVSNDLKSRYSGSAFGIVWAYVQPLVTVLVFWYVYQVGFRNAPVDDAPFILWFICAFIPWTFFSDGSVTSAGVMYEYSYLVKKMRFKVWQLPLIKVCTSFRIHCFFIVFLTGMFLLYGYVPSMSWLDTLYYSLYISVLLIGNAYLNASLTVFIKDFGQLVNVVMQIGFWLTPVFWSDATMSPDVLGILRLNPMYYATTGYRYALIHNTWFWERPIELTAYYWLVAFGVVAVGILVFRRSQEHFTDVL